MKIKRYSFWMVFVVLFFTACNEPDLTPAYLVITEADLQNCVDVSQFNATHDQSYDQVQLDAIASHRFRNAWVYLNGKNLGCWELPCKIPILPHFDGENEVKLVPGIRLNGMSSMIPAYPFLVPFTFSTYFEREGTYHLTDHHPTFVYQPTTLFPLLETFDQSTTFSPVDTGGIAMTIVNDGIHSIGEICLTDTLKYFDIKSEEYVLKGNGNFTFWEMDYKCDEHISCGLFVRTISGMVVPVSLVSLNPSKGEWRKVYINLTTVLANYTGVNTTVPVQLVMTGNRKGDQSDTYFQFDNIKIVTFK